MIWITIALITIASIAKALQDLAMINAYPVSWTWWNMKTSWRMKDELENRILGKQNDFVEWLFHTVLVWVTDGWHLWQLVKINCLMVGVYIWALDDMGMHHWLKLLVVVLWYKSLFELFYSVLRGILKKK